MKVILKQDIKAVGKMDDVVNVTPGYARNYLFPRNLAVEATAQNLAVMKRKYDAIEKKGEKLVAECREIAENLKGKKITITARAGAGSKLYGSITSQDIADAVKSQTGVELDKRKIHIADPIKAAGAHNVPIRLHREVGFDLSVEVVTE
ncbi:MAG: 50S ribosomal protein L9 [Armatimonadota bacterium]